MKKITHLGTHKKIKIFSLLSAFCLLLSATFAQTWPPAGMQGAGTSGSPWEITTAAHLKALADYVNANLPNANSTAGKHYKLMNNIDLSDYATGEGWIPIGRLTSTNDRLFKGNFNGNNKVITGLYLNEEPNDYYARQGKGLFGRIMGATIENLGIENGNIACLNGINVGGIVGYVYQSNISNCWFTGSVAACNCVGGIVGNGETITNCFFEGTVTKFGYNNDQFGGIAGTAYNVTNCYSTGEINGNGKVGGIAGTLSASGTITNCYSTCTVSGSSFVGGIVGQTSGTVTNCYSTGTVIVEDNRVGGIAGDSKGEYYTPNELKNCVALNPSVIHISGTNYDGRIVGKIEYTTLANNAAFDGILNTNNNTTWNNKGANKIDGADMSATAIQTDGTLGGRFTTAGGWTIQNGKLPGLFGNTVDIPSHITGSGGTTYTIMATASANGTITPSGAITVPENENKTFTFSADDNYEIDQVLVDGANIPTSVISGTYTFTNVTANHTIAVSFKQETWPPAGMKGNGTENNPWLIETPLHLRKLAVYVNNGNGNETKGKYYKMMNNLNLSEYAAGDGWMPIGKDDNNCYFKGNFNGNGKIITELKINRSTLNYVGLFGRVEGALFENLGIVDVEVTGRTYAGGLVGGCAETKISGCYVTGYLKNEGSGGMLVGSLYNSSSLINCYTEGKVESPKGIIGGLVGDASTLMEPRLMIRNCYSSCNVSSNSNYVGGLVGITNLADIIDCYATGNVTGPQVLIADAGDAGGLAGRIDKTTLINCSATGEVKSLARTGGLVGFSNDSEITDCFATGKVIGSQGVGGLAGSHNGTIKDCFATGNVYGRSTVGGLVGYAGKYGYSIITSFILNCYATGYISINSEFDPALASYVGGLVGTNYGAISNCYSKGSVMGTGSVGGLVGDNYKGSISHCYTTGKITGNTSGGEVLGGLVGNYSWDSETAFVRDCLVVCDTIKGLPANSLNIGWFAGGNVYTKMSFNHIYKEVVKNGPQGYIKPLDDPENVNPFMVNTWDTLTSVSFYTVAHDPLYWFELWDFVNVWTLEGGKGIEELPRFKQKSYTITATAGANGKITPNGEVTVLKGESQFYSITPNGGYLIDKVLVDGENYLTATVTGTYTFIKVGTNHTIEVSFRVNDNPVVPVTNITGVPATAMVGIPLTLTGTIIPSDATNQTIEWSVKNAGTTGATISGNIFNTTATGTAEITATIENGTAVGTDYKQNFSINVNPVGISESNFSGINIYPNPTTGELRVMSEELRVEGVYVFDIYGRKVGGKFPSNVLEGWQPQADGVVINISHLPSGIYFLQIHTEQGTVNKKIVKQ